jgi:uridine kinase
MRYEMRKRPYVVGISGGTCSGKSTVADILAKALGEKYTATVINMDRYYKKPIIRTIAPFTRKEYAEANHPDSLERDRLFSDYLAAIGDAGNDIVIVEGLFSLYYDEIRERLDLKVFIDLKSDERMYRRIKRWMDRQPLDEIALRYLDTVRYRHDEFVEPTRWHADMIINGSLDANMGTRILESYIIEAMRPA